MKANDSDDVAAPIQGFRLALLVGVLLLAQVLDGMDMNALAFVGPAVSKDLALSRTMFGACIGLGFLGTAIGAVAFGGIADHWGKRRTLVIVVALFGLGSLATSLVDTAMALLALRVLTGMALGGLLPISSALLIGRVSPSARTTAVTIVTAGSAGGAVLAGLVASFVTPHFGWRSMFVIGGLAPIAIIPLLLAIIPADRRPGNVRSHQPAVGLARGRALFGGGAWRLTMLLWTGMFLSAAPVFVAVGWLPTLIETAGASVATAALTASLFSVGGAVGGVAAGSLADRFGIRVMLPFTMAGVVAVISLGLTIGSIAIVPIAGVAGFFAIGLLTLMSATVGQFYPDEIRALSVGASLAVMRIGAAAAPWAAGHLLDLGLSPGGLFAGCAAIGLASGLAFSGAARQRGAVVEKGVHSGIAH